VLHFNVTSRPGAEWTRAQIGQAFLVETVVTGHAVICRLRVTPRDVSETHSPQCSHHGAKGRFSPLLALFEMRKPPATGEGSSHCPAISCAGRICTG
jgi:hypothetical protein